MWLKVRSDSAEYLRCAAPYEKPVVVEPQKQKLADTCRPRAQCTIRSRSHVSSWVIYTTDKDDGLEEHNDDRNEFQYNGCKRNVTFVPFFFTIIHRYFWFFVVYVCASLCVVVESQSYTLGQVQRLRLGVILCTMGLFKLLRCLDLAHHRCIIGVKIKTWHKVCPFFFNFKFSIRNPIVFLPRR